KANLCEIKISETNEETSIMIKDNGIGFDQQTISYSTHGIRGMIERLEFMNGNLSIHSNNGTQIKFHFLKLFHKQRRQFNGENCFSRRSRHVIRCSFYFT